MSQFAPPPQKPDGRIFASYPMPAKIDLLNERPRCESLIERQLEYQIGQPVPRIEVTEQKSMVTDSQWAPNRCGGENLIRQPMSGRVSSTNYSTIITATHHNVVGASQRQDPQQHPNWQIYDQGQQQQLQQVPNLTSRTQTTNIRQIISNNAANLAAELAEKEAKLMAEIEALHRRPYNADQTPAKIDLTREQRIAQQQHEHAPSPRPYSRASSTRSTTADLLDKEAKLMQQIEEIESKPFNPQTMVVEREQWSEYPEGRPSSRHLTDSKRRVKDFCSLPSYMYEGQDRHVHEELPIATQKSKADVQTLIIRSPKREIDNKSPLPFAFDNFSTKGVRGNIASATAVEPERPRPPIYPIIKRS